MPPRPFVFLAGLLSISLAHAPLVADEPASPQPAVAATASPQTGALEGTVIYKADAKRPWRYARYYVKDKRQGYLGEAVVALKSKSVPRQASDEAATTVVDQENFQFIPETVAIRAGDRVKFLNNDGGVHNVRTAHRRHSFNTNIPPSGEHVETFQHASGIRSPYHVECVYHSSMRSWIYVFDHPYYQLTGTDGRFRLANIPPGQYVLEMVHPAGQLQWRGKVDIEPGQTRRLDIVVSPDDEVPERP